MSDPNKYINTYVDVTLGTVHELLNQVLQLKTEARVVSDLVKEKDQIITTLQSEKEHFEARIQQEQEKNRLEHEEVARANSQVRDWENQVNAMKHKADNFDTLANQFNDIKNKYVAKEKELENVKKDLEASHAKVKELQKIDRQVKKEEKKSHIVTVKDTINKETTPVPLQTKTVKVVVPEEETDDF